MRQSRFTEEQIVACTRGAGTQELGAGAAEITTQTLYRWEPKYGGMSVSGAQRLPQLDRTSGAGTTWISVRGRGLGQGCSTAHRH